MSLYLPAGEQLRRTLKWMNDRHLAEPEATRSELVERASMQFDLSPAFEEWLLMMLNGEVEES